MTSEERQRKFELEMARDRRMHNLGCAMIWAGGFCFGYIVKGLLG